MEETTPNKQEYSHDVCGEETTQPLTKIDKLEQDKVLFTQIEIYNYIQTKNKCLDI